MIRTYQTEKALTPKRKKYLLSTFKGVNTTVAEEILPLSYSPKSYNFIFGKGVLDTGYGVDAAYVRTGEGSWQIKRRGISVKFLRFYRYTIHNLSVTVEKLVAYGDDGKLYDFTLNELYSGFTPIGSYGVVTDAVPYVYNGDDGLLVATTTGLYFLRESTMTRLTFSEIFTTMCVHGDRVFAVSKLDEYKLYFSDDFDPKNWAISMEEGGYISFDTALGKLIKVVDFAGNVCLFFEHGVMKLTAYNLQTEFRLQKLYFSPGTIYRDTIAICGDRIAFAATDGIFLFDGVSISEILTEIEDLISSDMSYAQGVYHGGKYYLACRMEIDSLITGANNSLIVYDLGKKTFEIAHDLAVLSMISLDLDTVRGVLTNVTYPLDYLGVIAPVGRISTTPLSKVWQSPITSLGSHDGRKFLREMRIRAEGAGTLRLTMDGEEHTYSLASGLNKVKVMRPFDRLQVTLTSNEAAARVTLVELTVDHYGE